MDYNHLLHHLNVGSTTVHEERLRFRDPFVNAARKLLNEQSKMNNRDVQWADYKGNARYSESQLKLRFFIPRSSAMSVGLGLPKLAWGTA